MIEPQLVLELLVRTLATAGIVMLVVEIAARAGPSVGGVIAGLPIVLGPGYFFLLREQPPAFVAEAAAGSLLSLSATQIFLFVHIVAAARATAIATLALAAFCWALSAAVLGLFEPSLFVGGLSFVGVTLAARIIGRGFVTPLPPPKTKRGQGVLLLRGITAGLLVAFVSLGSSAFGTVVSGALMAFPIGFSVIGLSLYRDHGPAMAIRTAYASLYGLTSLAVFCATLSLSLRVTGSATAFLLSLAMSALTTMMVLAFARRFGDA